MRFDRYNFIDKSIETKILQTLKDIERQYDVKILHAAESGSRAWGFPSPNSDYDVRFFYVHKRDWYLSVYPERDVIELPIDETYDVSGWDLKKAIHLAMKSNAVVMEWLQSPIVYQSNSKFVDVMKEFYLQNSHPKPLMHHYINLGTRQIDQLWRTSDAVQVKKYFYMARPAMALRWLMLNESRSDVPMTIQTLMEQSEIPKHVHDLICDLIERKNKCEEKAEVSHVKEIDDFILSVYDDAKSYVASMPAAPPHDINRANKFFRNWII